MSKRAGHLEYESDIEQFLVRLVASQGGLCIKVGYDGLPDRLVLLPGARLAFVELKRNDGATSALQEYRAKILLDLGFPVAIPKSKRDCELLVGSLMGGWAET